MHSVESLKQTILDRIEECRLGVSQGEPDLTGVEEGVRAYCQALAALPAGQGRAHAGDLEALLKAVETLGKELAAAQATIRGELTALDHFRRASTAYHKSDAIGGPHEPKKESDE